MFCKYCRNKTDDNDNFCGRCGKTTTHSNIDLKIPDPKIEKIQISDFSILRNTKKRDYLSTILYKKSLRRLYFGYFLLAISVIIFINLHNYIANLISGPRSIDAISLESELLSNNIKDLNINLELLPELVYKTGYTAITQTIDKYTHKVKNETTNQEYYLTILGQHILVLEGSPQKIPNNNFEGALLPLSTELQKKLSADFDMSKESASSNKILPYMLSNKGMTGLPAFWKFLFAIVLGCWGGKITYKQIIDREDKKNFIYQIPNLVGYQNMHDFSQDFIHANNTEFIKIGNYKLNSKFLFRDNFFSFEIYPMSKMFWAYKKITKKSVNFIPTGKDYEIVMHFKPNKILSIKESKKHINQRLIFLMHLCPEAKFGYTN